jgi:CBS-domain-containing membrane protein
MVETGLRRLPVVQADGTLVGILGRADLLQVVVTSPLMSPHASSATQPLSMTGSLPQLLVQQQPIAGYVNPDVATVRESSPLEEVIDALIVSPVKRVVVVDAEQRVKGIMSDVDVLERLQEEMRPSLLAMLTGRVAGKQKRPLTSRLRSPLAKAPVAADIMNREVITVPETTSVQETIERMIATRRKILPVVDAQDRLVGVVGRSDLLRVLLEE